MVLIHMTDSKDFSPPEAEQFSRRGFIKEAANVGLGALAYGISGHAEPANASGAPYENPSSPSSLDPSPKQAVDPRFSLPVSTEERDVRTVHIKQTKLL